EPGAPQRLRMDMERIRNEVLGNLLSNAFKFTPEGGRITVLARGADDGVEFEVSDSGVGIPEADLPHIFDKYYQVGRAARRAGAGLGLAIARQIVEAHGGSIAAESQAGAGTTFRVRLPRVAAGGARSQRLASAGVE